MKGRLFLLYVSALLILTSCVDIIDDLSFHADGSGTFRYSINLSSSKAKVNSILALDSLNGKPVPSKEEIKRKIAEFKLRFSEKKGISNLNLQEDYDNYLFKIQCDFSNIIALQTAIRQTINEISRLSSDQSTDNEEWLILKDQQLTRHIPPSIIYNIKKLNKDNSDQLKLGSYTSITRFDTTINSFDNPLGLLSKNKQSLLIRCDILSLMYNPQLLDNLIVVNR